MKLMARYVTFLILAMCGCSKSGDVTPVSVSESKFLITNTNASGAGTISEYKKPDGISTDAAYTLSVKLASPETIADFQIYNGKVYMVRSRSGLIEVANLTDFSQSQTIVYAKPLATNVYKHIAIANNKIFVADRDFISPTTSQNTAFLKVITLGQSKVDSIGIVKNAPITAVAVSSRYVYVSGGMGPQTIFVIDPNTYAKVAAIAISGFCTELLMDNEDNILAFYNGRITKFSGVNFSMLKDRLIGGAIVNIENDDVMSNTAFALDKTANIVYYLSNAPQPASAPYILSSYDLGKDEIVLISNKFITAQTIGFDKVDKQIILGDFDATANKGVIKFLTTKGEVKSQFTIPGTPGAIQIDQ
jgi:hypothetical protein